MQGLSPEEHRLIALLEEVLERFRWLQVLAHTQSFLLREKLKIPEHELESVLEAASRTVDKDAQLRSWQEELGRLKGGVKEARRSIRRERKQLKREAKSARDSAPGANDGDESSAEV